MSTIVVQVTLLIDHKHSVMLIYGTVVLREAADLKKEDRRRHNKSSVTFACF